MQPTAANPLGLDGFEFIEFTAPDPEAFDGLFTRFGLAHLADHRTRAIRRYGRRDVNFLLDCEPLGRAAEFRAAHGASASAVALRVEHAERAFALAVERGATPVDPAGLSHDLPAIEGVGGAILYLVDRPAASQLYGWHFERTADGEDMADAGLCAIDHIAQNFMPGGVERWAEFYTRVFGLEETRRFEIRGRQTGLVSRAMALPGSGVRIPLNESGDEHSQINEFLRAHRGEGVQHIALATEDIGAAVDALRANGIAFQDTPDTYFDAIDERLPGHGEDVEALRARGILIDGSADGGEGLLLQIFTRNLAGPIFFEIIQRKRNEGFGEGNITALFESIEREQIARGAIPALGTG